MTRTAPGTEDTLQARARFFHDAFARWLAEPGVTIACGRWAEGAISEIMPMGRATLLPGVYDDCFSGIREVRLDGQPHHLHIDFGRVHAFSYAIAPSVCMAFKPSFEVRLLVIGPGGLPSDRWIVSLMLAAPYKDGVLDHPAIVAFFQRAQRDAAERPDLVELQVDPAVRGGPVAPQILAAIAEATGQSSVPSWLEALAALCPASASSADSTAARLASKPERMPWCCGVRPSSVRQSSSTSRKPFPRACRRPLSTRAGPGAGKSFGAAARPSRYSQITRLS
jgi:hypothetical protein